MYLAGMEVKNLLKDLPESKQEVFDTLVKTDTVLVERIVSSGQATPTGEWLKSNQDEFVLLVTGGASISFQEGKTVKLNPGDYLLIPKGRAHRVVHTETRTPTVWLTVYH